MDHLDGLTTSCFGRSFLHLDEVDSTNNYLKTHAATLPHGTAVAAKRQFGGKGRMGKSWSAVEDDGHSLAFSLLLRDSICAEDLTLLPLLTGIGVCRAVAQMSGCAPKIKWSNDVLLEDKKLCGILCESRLLPGEPLFAVLGMGVNLLQTREEFDRLALVYATSLLLATKKCYAPLPTAARILSELEPVWDTYKSRGFAALKAEYLQLCITIGRQVRILRDGQSVEALAQDIADDGSLICTGADGKTLLVSAGEASVRGVYGYV